MQKRIVFLSIFLLLCLLCSCDGTLNLSDLSTERDTAVPMVRETTEEAYYEDTMGADDTVIYESKAVANDASAAGSAQTRMIQKSASETLTVSDPVKTAEKIIRHAEYIGGFVVSSENGQEWYSGEQKLPKVELSLRVPAEKLDEFLGFAEALTSDPEKYVTNKRITGVDITSDYVDTSSRLRGLEKTRDKLYEILDTAENAEETMMVYEEISSVESEIEVLTGQIKYMEESVSLSSVYIQLRSIPPEPLESLTPWDPGQVVRDACGTLIEKGKTVINGLLYFFIVGLPLILLIAVPVTLVILLIRRVIGRIKAGKTGGKQSKK